MKSIIVVFSIGYCSLAHGACLSYHDKVIITGNLSQHTFPEQPNYASIANGDAPSTYFFLTPPMPVCVQAGNIDENELDEPEVTRIQLVFYKDGSYARLRPFLGKKVTCKGGIFHAITGHHHSKVLLENAICKTLTNKPIN
jgi:hypothetical protein